MTRRKRGARKCRHRSKSIGTLKAGCSACSIYRCAKYDTLCTLVTPQSYGGILARDNSRPCSICVASGENE